MCVCVGNFRTSIYKVPNIPDTYTTKERLPLKFYVHLLTSVKTL